MILAIPFPDISPEIFSIEIGGFQFALRWYALSYIVGIVIGWRMLVAAVRRPGLWPGGTAPATPVQVDDLVTWIIIGIIVGGRLGFVLFYEPAYYLANPIDILKVWQGGMAFHGGFLGVVIASAIFLRKNGIPVAQIADGIAMSTPPALALVRVANFINAELWGRPTDVPWAVIFPGPLAQACPGVEGLCARHPSQLYEAALEGVVLGLVLLWLVYRRGTFTWPWLTTGVFLAGYGAARIFVEFYRQADPQFITPDNPTGAVFVGMTMGQLLSLPMLLVGLALIALALARGRRV
ncbi:MAG: prolipoprotein diacylglyceryl transferase [Shimia sp.]